MPGRPGVNPHRYADNIGTYSFDSGGQWGHEKVTGYREPDEEIAGRLLDFLANIRPAWHADAACRGADPDIWFPISGTPQTRTDLALETCARCPVNVQCREAGKGETFGIWGGQRQSDRGERGRPAPTGIGRSVRHRPSRPVDEVGTWCHDFYRIAGHGSLLQHSRRGVDTCEPCRTFRATYQRERTASQ